MSTQEEKRVAPSTHGVRPNAHVVKQAGLPVTELMAQEETAPGACGHRMPHCGERDGFVCLFIYFEEKRGDKRGEEEEGK